MDERIIGIDLGNDCGFAVVDPNGQRITSGTWVLDPGKRIGRRRAHPAGRWIAMLTHCRELLAEHRPRFVVFEQIQRHSGVDAAHCYGGFKAQLEIAAFDAKVPLLSMTPNVCKFPLTGFGQCKPEVYIKAVNRRLGLALEAQHEDEAAALGIAIVAVDKRLAPTAGAFVTEHKKLGATP
jgi:Holliday junction resolvasome RuvABC endonuclease subunit